MKRERESGIELLRVILMIMIVFGHLVTHTDIRKTLPLLTAKWNIVWALQTITVSAVNCFVIISGYFLSQHGTSLIKIVKIETKMFFYSIGIFCACYQFAGGGGGISAGIQTIFPFLAQEYWFMSCYILLMILSPIVNASIINLSAIQTNIAIALICTFFYVLPVFNVIIPTYDTENGFGIINFVCLYFIGAWIKQNKWESVSNKKLCFVILINNAFVFTSKVALELIINKLGLSVGTGLLYHYNVFPQLVNAVAIFLIFTRIRITGVVKKVVLWVSPTLLSVYLIHEQPLMRNLLWKTGLAELLTSSSVITFVAFVLTIPISVFIICVLIDKIVSKVIFNRFFESGLFRKICGKCKAIDCYFVAGEAIKDKQMCSQE